MFDQDHPETSRKGRVRFDATINLGHVLTFIGFVFSGIMIWTALDKRVVVLEEARVAQRAIDQRQDNELADSKKTLREDLKEISAKIDRLIERAK